MQFVKDVNEMAQQGFEIHSWQTSHVTGMIVALYVLALNDPASDNSDSWLRELLAIANGRIKHSLRAHDPQAVAAIGRSDIPAL